MTSKTKNLALYCDFENIALGVRDAKYSRFDIEEVLERLLVKGNIVVKRPIVTGSVIKILRPTCMRLLLN